MFWGIILWKNDTILIIITVFTYYTYFSIGYTYCFYMNFSQLNCSRLPEILRILAKRALLNYCLQRHYHSTVQKIAKNIASGVPTSGEGSLPPEIGKL